MVIYAIIKSINASVKFLSVTETSVVFLRQMRLFRLLIYEESATDYMTDSSCQQKVRLLRYNQCLSFVDQVRILYDRLVFVIDPDPVQTASGKAFCYAPKSITLYNRIGVAGFRSGRCFGLTGDFRCYGGFGSFRLDRFNLGSLE